ncbi:hypothetical protein T12_16222, partial [Trichinella patagoniensis]
MPYYVVLGIVALLLMENWVVLREANSLQCYQSCTWSTIIPLFNTIRTSDAEEE